MHKNKQRCHFISQRPSRKVLSAFFLARTSSAAIDHNQSCVRARAFCQFIHYSWNCSKSNRAAAIEPSHYSIHARCTQPTAHCGNIYTIHYIHHASGLRVCSSLIRSRGSRRSANFVCTFVRTNCTSHSTTWPHFDPFCKNNYSIWTKTLYWYLLW